MHYGAERDSFKKFANYQDRSGDYKPDVNAKNIYERKLTRFSVPKTRDRFVANAFA